MKLKYITTFLLLSLLTLSLSSCHKKSPGEIFDKVFNSVRKVKTTEEDKTLNESLIKKDLPLINHSKTFYKLNDDKVTTYFINEEKVPYVGLKEFLTSLDGFYDSKDFRFNFKEDKQLGKVSLMVNKYECSIKLDTKKDLIIINDDYILAKTNTPSSISYDNHIKASKRYTSKKHDKVFDLDKYNFNMVFKDDDIIVPFSVLNLLLATSTTANINFNEKEFNFYSTYLDDYEEYFNSRNKELNNTSIPKEIVLERNKSLALIFDEFYGLKEVTKTKNFEDILNKDENLKRLANSTSSKDAEEFYSILFNTKFDDPHTSLEYKGNYSEVNEIRDMFFFERNSNSRYNNILTTYNELIESYKETFNSESIKIYREEGNTAFIKFDDFSVGMNDEIYDEFGNVKPDAYLYDTFYLLKTALLKAKENSKIKNIVLDVSTNLGGLILSAIRGIGLITIKDPIFIERDILSDETLTTFYKVDADEDDDYFDDDAFDEFNYFVLTSNATFSSGNIFTSMAKDLGIAKIIGEKSGGGICSVNPYITLDGTSIRYSSPQMMLGFDMNDEEEFSYHYIEEGVELDYEIPKNKFYDLSYLNNFINSLN